jgi:hypothetical protein
VHFGQKFIEVPFDTFAVVDLVETGLQSMTQLVLRVA